MRSAQLWSIALCLVTALAAWRPWSVPLVMVVALLAVAFVSRNRVLVIAAVGLVVSSYGAHEWRALDRPVAASVSGIATIVRDPKVVNHATSAEVRLNGRLYQAWAYGGVAARLREGRAGDRVYVSGNTRALSGVTKANYRRRHVVAGINVTNAQVVDSGSFLARSANGLRTMISRGADSMPREERTLLTGFVYGDDREESQQTQDDFQAAGLSHLLAVSGENVAFVLLLMAPLLKRFSLAGRFVGGIALLLLFGVVTRWEPSVVRAEMMAVVALVAIWQGRPTSKWLCLSLGSTAALVVDPFLIGSVGFLLSVSACVGMALLGQAFFDRLRGPLWIRRALSYSAAAQLGVAPVQWIVFHQMPVVGLITNVIAEPIAGFVMVWGVVGGVTAGVVDFAGIPHLIHFPDTLALRFVRQVAHFGALVESTSVGKWFAGMFTLSLLGVMVVRKPATTLEQRGSSAAGLPTQG